MNQLATEQELVVLKLLLDSEGPVGAGTVRDRLLAEGFSASEATVGRLLRELDRRGITSRVGFQGRVLTGLGSRRLAELSAEKEQGASIANLLKSVRSSGENTADLLEARKAVECRIARLAAERASAQSRKGLEDLRDRLKEAQDDEDFSLEEYRKVFRLLSETAGNAILEAIDEVLLGGGDGGTGLSEGPRSGLAGELVAIVELIIGNDPASAGKALCRHIDGLIEKRGEGP
jgi:GntR family L-lactate dehydrogenase operon transcriptional regulator